MVIQTLNEVISQKYALAARNALDAINEAMSPSERGPLMHEANHRLHQAICSLWGSALPPRRIRAEWRPASRVTDLVKVLDSLPHLSDYKLTSREMCWETEPEFMEFDFLAVDFLAEGRVASNIDWSDSVCSSIPAYAVINWILSEP